MRIVFFGVFFSLLMTACAPLPHNVKPDRLQTHGLLVGSIVGDPLDLLKGNKDPVEQLLTGNRYYLHLDKKTYYINFYNDIFIVDLPPGEYEIRGISANKRSFAFKLKFTIYPGEITNLGAIYSLLIPGSERSGQKRYNVFQVNNDALISDYLSEVKPDIYNALKGKDINKNNTFLSTAQLNELRRRIASSLATTQLLEMNRQNTFIRSLGGTGKVEQSFLVSGDLGVAGWFDSRVDKYRPLPFDTIENVKECKALGERFACILGTKRSDSYSTVKVISGRGAEPDSVELPPDVQPVALHLFGEDGIAVMGSDFHSYVKTKEGDEWKVYQQPKRGLANGKKYTFVDVKKGYYTYYHDDTKLINNHFLTFTRADDGEEVMVELPKDFGSQCSDILSSSGGIVVGPNWSVVALSKIYALDSNGDWATIQLPQRGCRSLNRFSDKPDDFIITCNETHLRSTDGGFTWSPIKKWSASK